MLSRQMRSRAFAMTLAIGAFTVASTVHSSPTSDEFRHCADRSSETLKNCLYRNLNKVEHNCWEVSKDLLDACNRHVRNQYVRPAKP